MDLPINPSLERDFSAPQEVGENKNPEVGGWGMPLQ